MSIHDERELRDRLACLMGDLEPRTAPVTSAMRQGRGIRMRRWVSAAAGIAALAAGAIAVPWLLSQRPPAPSAPKHYKITVVRLGSRATGGVIGEDIIDGQRFRIVVDRKQGDGCFDDAHLLDCGTATGGSAGAREVSLASNTFNGTQFEVGTVGAEVSRLVIQMSNGSQLDLRPVAAYGQRWVAFAAPGLTIRRAVSYVGPAEYQYAIPFMNVGSEDFVTWLRTGEAGLPRVSKALQSGELDGVSWYGRIEIGPWGYCGVFTNGSECFPGTSVPQLVQGRRLFAPISCGPLYTSSGRAIGASSGIAAVPLTVRYVVLKFADGSQRQLTAITVAGTAAVAYAIRNHPKVVRTLEFGPDRKLVRSGSGAGWGC